MNDKRNARINRRGLTNVERGARTTEVDTPLPLARQQRKGVLSVAFNSIQTIELPDRSNPASPILSNLDRRIRDFKYRSDPVAVVDLVATAGVREFERN